MKREREDQIDGMSKIGLFLGAKAVSENTADAYVDAAEHNPATISCSPAKDLYSSHWNH